MQSKIQRAWRFVLPQAPEYEPTSLRRAWLLTLYTLRRWLVIDRALHLASSLALETLLSLVPTAGVLLFFVRLLDPDFGRTFVANLALTLIPGASRAAEFTEQVVDLGTHVNVEHLGLSGFVLVALLAFWLYMTLEGTLNTIWRAPNKRPIFAQFTMFYTLATLGPVVAFYSLAQPLLTRLSESVLVSPWVTSAIGLTLINRIVPHTRVLWRAALVGGCLSAGLFEIGKFGFGIYLTNVTLPTYEGVYGPFTILPVFIIWTYLSWLIVLLGAECAFVYQHLSAVSRQGYVHPSNRRAHHFHTSPGRTAAQILLAICDNFERRELGMTRDMLDARFQLGPTTTMALLEQLEAAGFVVALDEDRGYVPGRPLEQLSLLETLRLFSSDPVVGPEQLRRDALADLFDRVDSSEREVVDDLNFAQLVAAGRQVQAPKR